MSVTTTVNGNELRLIDSEYRTDRAADARRLCATLDRSDDRISRVAASVTSYAAVWLNMDADGAVGFDAPEGFTIDDVMVSSSNAVCVWLSRDD